MRTSIIALAVLMQGIAFSASSQLVTNATGRVWTAGPYAYDGAGNITAIGSGDPSVAADKYVYDKLGRLRSGTAGPIRLQEYAYDAYGNIVTATTTSPDQATYSLKPCVDPATNQIDRVGTDCNASGVYDGSGNMTSYGPSSTFIYDATNTVTETTLFGRRTVHLYTASDERIASVTIVNNVPVSSEWTIRDNGGRVLRRFGRTASGTWNWTEDYIYREGTMLAAEVSGPERTLHFHPDHLGTPRVITGSGGAEVARHTYYPFGQEATNPGQDSERKKFTSHERDDNNLDYMHARYYMPFTGRFLSVDPTWESAESGRVQSWNRYAYVLNNPIGATDPDGRKHRWYQDPAKEYSEVADQIKPIAAAARKYAGGSGADVILTLAEKTLRLGTATGEVLESRSSTAKKAMAISGDVATAAEAFSAMAGPVSSALRSTTTGVAVIGNQAETAMHAARTGAVRMAVPDAIFEAAPKALQRMMCRGFVLRQMLNGRAIVQTPNGGALTQVERAFAAALRYRVTSLP